MDDAVAQQLIEDMAAKWVADTTLELPSSLPPAPIDPVEMLREVDRLLDRLPIVVCSAEDEQRVRASIPWDAPMRVQVDSQFAAPGTAYVINPEGLLPWTT